MSKIISRICFLYTTHRNILNQNKRIAKRLCSSLTVQQKPQTSIISFNKDSDEIDWEKELTQLRHEDKQTILEACKEDLSYIGPYTKPTFNFAAYINKSDTLKKLVQLGVDLHKIEKKKDAPEYVLALDFDKDIKNHILFLRDLGVSEDILGEYITRNPYIFKEDIETLTVRLNYLESKAFNKNMISRIITKNPYWLMFSTKRIDTRLGHFQKTFKLTGPEVRKLATKQPRLITYNMNQIKLNTFAIKEEMGFSEGEMKKLLLAKPKLWMLSQDSILKRFNYIHNTMNISHEYIVQMPKILTCRKTRIQQRHQFLVKLGRAQYDPKKENYVSLEGLAEGTDVKFCSNVAKSTVEAFNVFLKSL